MPRILVVDDSKTQRMLARIVLEDAGYEVLEAEDGDSGVAVASREAPDCILLDLHLPGDSGQDVLQSLHEKRLSIPVIISSAGVDAKTQSECLALGAAAVIDKPNDSQQLDKLIKSVLNR